MKVLLNRGADPSLGVACPPRNTSLHLAAAGGGFAACEVLLTFKMPKGSCRTQLKLAMNLDGDQPHHVLSYGSAGAIRQLLDPLVKRRAGGNVGGGGSESKQGKRKANTADMHDNLMETNPFGMY